MGGLVWVLRRCPFNAIHHFFVSREMQFVLLSCTASTSQSHSILLNPHIGGYPLLPRKHYQVVGPPYLPLEWRKIMCRVILLIFKNILWHSTHTSSAKISSTHSSNWSVPLPKGTSIVLTNNIDQSVVFMYVQFDVFAPYLSMFWGGV